MLEPDPKLRLTAKQVLGMFISFHVHFILLLRAFLKSQLNVKSFSTCMIMKSSEEKNLVEPISFNGKSMHISLIDSTINQDYRMKLAVNIFGSDPCFL